MTLLGWLACSQYDAPPPLDSGWVPPADVEPGELVVSEIMADPAAVQGDLGEYVEVTSTAERELDLLGLGLADQQGEGLVVTVSLVVPVGGRVVFGPSDNRGINGGAPVDYAYDLDALRLASDGDEVRLLAGDDEIDRVRYEVDWGVVEGAALSLDPAALDPEENDRADRWCPATRPYGAGDLGTPGEPNDPCPPSGGL